jgi:hypothetical protein
MEVEHVITIVVLIATIPAVVIVFAVALLRAGINREDADHSIYGPSPSRTSAMTRRVVGLYVRTPAAGHQEDPRTDGRGSTAHLWPSGPR